MSSFYYSIFIHYISSSKEFRIVCAINISWKTCKLYTLYLTIVPRGKISWKTMTGKTSTSQPLDQIEISFRVSLIPIECSQHCPVIVYNLYSPQFFQYQKKQQHLSISEEDTLSKIISEMYFKTFFNVNMPINSKNSRTKKILSK